MFNASVVSIVKFQVFAQYLLIQIQNNFWTPCIPKLK